MSNRVHFIVVDPGDGRILRTGSCVLEDAPLQGDQVIVSVDDPGVSGVTHRFDLATHTFVTLQTGA